VDVNDSIFNQICEKIVGRIGITEAETGLLVEVVKKSPRDCHFEVGCLWGGTAIAVALANPELEIVTVDLMEGGFWESKGDPVACMKPTFEIVLENFKIFGVEDRITAVKADSYPWPFRLSEQCFSFFIDGDHSRPGVLRDWSTAQAVATNFVLFHDYQTPSGLHKGVEQAIDEVVLKAKDWRVYKQVETLIVFEKAR